MKQNFSVVFQKPTGEQVLEVGAKLVDKDGKETEIKVEKITVFFKTVKVTISDGRELIFKGFPFIITKK